MAELPLRIVSVERLQVVRLLLQNIALRVVRLERSPTPTLARPPSLTPDLRWNPSYAGPNPN